MLRKDMLMEAHHVGYAVKDHEGASEAFMALGYTCVQEKMYDSGRNLWISFVRNGGILVELISIADCDLPSPLDSILKGSTKATPYHICYEVENLDRAIEYLNEQKYVNVKTPLEAPALDGRRVAFLFHRNSGLIELVEKEI